MNLMKKHVAKKNCSNYTSDIGYKAGSNGVSRILNIDRPKINRYDIECCLCSTS